MASKTVLVHSCVHKKVVFFSGDLENLKQAVLGTFSLQVSPEQLLMQVKSEVLEWKGEWADVSSTDEIVDKAIIKAVIIETEEKRYFFCTDCPKSYSRKDNLKQHMKSAHGLNGVKPGRFTCAFSGCDERFYHAKQLTLHYNNHHNLNMTIQSKEFSNWRSFEAWKEEEELRTHSNFSQPNGSIKRTKCSTDEETRSVSYYCCRDGKFRENNQARMTESKRKRKRSRKLDSTYCVARMTATESTDTGRVMVEYVSTHTNHQLDAHECINLPLPKSTHRAIKEKIALGIPIERIMDDIRGDIGTRHIRSDYVNQVTRNHFITRQDCRNIARSLNSHRHANDAVSVDRIVCELKRESPSPVLVYKPQGAELYSLAADTFILVLMTPFQADLFSTFGEKIVCFDSTHGTNEYQFKLITLLIVDEYRNGQPVVWMISNKEDSSTLKIMFEALKKYCTKGVINNLMTDDDSAGFLACQQVYPGVKHLLCRWHVDRAWQRKIRSIVKDVEHQMEIYACLYSLITEGDIDKFTTYLDTFIKYWHTKEPKFIDYFKQFYCNRTEKWALCFRFFDHNDADTNNYIESFHNKLKTNPKYLHHRVNRRCDDLIEILLKFEEDMFHNRMTREILCSQKDASLCQEGTHRHQNGMQISDDDIMVLDSKTFEVQSNSDIVYRVCIEEEKCCNEPDCIPQCTECCIYLCRHIIQCSCLDYAHGHLCKHAHKVWSKVVAEKVADQQQVEPLKTAASFVTATAHINDNSKFQQNIAERKRSIQVYTEALLSGIADISDLSTLEYVSTLLMKASAAVDAHTSSSQSKVIPSFELKNKTPPAKKLEKQMIFKKTTCGAGRKKTQTF